MPDRIPGEDWDRENEAPDEKREDTNEIISFIAIILIITSILAGIHSFSIWNSPQPATDFDLFLFFYAIIGFPVGLIMQTYANYINQPHSSSDDSTWWLW